MESIYNFFAYIGRLLSGDESVLDVLSNLVWGVIYLIVEGFLTIIESIIACIDLGTIAVDVVAEWGLLPDQLIFLINAVGLPQALAVIGWAYGIRFALNLIPSTLSRV